MRNFAFCVIFVAVLNAVGGSASAGLLTVINPSFESQSLAVNAFTVGTLTGWSAPGVQGAFRPGPTIYTAGIPDGNNVAFSHTGGGTISQILSDVLTANTLYTLSVNVGDRLDLTFSGYSINLLAGSTVLASTSTPVPLNGRFATATVQFQTLATHANLGALLQIQLITTPGGQVNYDNVRLDGTAVAAVPEPASIAMWSLGALGMMFARRKRQQLKLAA